MRRLMRRLAKDDELIEKLRMDANNNKNNNNGGEEEKSHGNTALPYGIAKGTEAQLCAKS